jgi:hypothetical protein
MPSIEVALTVPPNIRFDGRRDALSRPPFAIAVHNFPAIIAILFDASISSRLLATKSQQFKNKIPLFLCLL